ncbi:hypothetical protein RKLH11_3423 [Rhodobacteraceae bacterium KLH11]|nr:hypothetical protein RKLH11_3423 [Rhodobacteraceae bacterium KLH11]
MIRAGKLDRQITIERDAEPLPRLVASRKHGQPLQLSGLSWCS